MQRRSIPELEFSGVSCRRVRVALGLPIDVVAAIAEISPAEAARIERHGEYQGVIPDDAGRLMTALEGIVIARRMMAAKV